MRRPDLVLGGAVLMCLPMLPGLLHGTLPVTDALIRFLLALFVAFVAAKILASVFTRYSNEARRAEIMRKIEQATQAPPGDAPGELPGFPSDLMGQDGVSQR